MAKIDITRTELVWPGKYKEDGTLREVPRVNLPFQVIETVNESRATRDARRSDVQTSLFEFYQGNEGDTFEEGWKNKLIWGDNLVVMGSLLKDFSGKIDLIYIDPPFATGADFSLTAQIGESGERVFKEQSLIEEKAYRDTWGYGIDSYITMIHQRLLLMRDLLSVGGSIYVHCDWRVNSFIRLLMNEVFGIDNFVNEISWKRYAAHSLSDSGYDAITDTIFFYTRDISSVKFNIQHGSLSQDEVLRRFPHIEKETGRRYQHAALEKSSNVSSRGEPRCIQGRTVVSRIGWIWTQETIDQRLKDNPNLIHWTGNGRPRYKIYADEYLGYPLGDLWTDVNYLAASDNERLGYPTQKPEALLERIIKTSTDKCDLVADFFCGSGTSLAVAEKLGRRWIGCDLGRWGIHVTRKRLLGIENCKPFDVLNLGKYERQYWQGITFGEQADKAAAEQALYKYLAFILRLYGAQPVKEFQHLHGKKGGAMVHIGAVDAPVTINEVETSLDECCKFEQSELHVLGWEWEMGLAGQNSVRSGGLMHDVARARGVKLILLQIPREVMEQQTVDRNDVRFFELAYLNAIFVKPKELNIRVKLDDFVVPNSELIPDEVRDKVAKWSDYIDYWAVDWDFRNDTFMQGWVAYRTRKDRTLPLISDSHTYEKRGNYRALVKVIDIFGNDTSQAFDIEAE